MSDGDIFPSETMFSYLFFFIECTTSASTANETRPKVTIKSLHPLAYWRYNCKGTECQICNHDLTNLCLSCFNRSKEGVAGPLEINPKCQVVIGRYL